MFRYFSGHFKTPSGWLQVHNRAVEEEGDGRFGLELLCVPQKSEVNLGSVCLSIGLVCTPAACFGKLGEHERECIH